MNHKTEYFRDNEFACKCGCGLNNPAPELKVRLNTAREIAGVSFVLNSACRCVTQNEDVGGLPTSSHTPDPVTGYCTAVDIKTSGSRNRFLIIDGLIKAGFTRIGVGKTFTHGDVDKDKNPKVMWPY